MREQHGAEHDFFIQLTRLRFYHHHGIAGGSDHQVEIASGGHFLLGVERVFAVNIADARCADRAHEGHARNGQRSRGGDHRQHIGLALTVKATEPGR